MGRYLSDFVTGRTIGGDDRIVAVVIIPTEGGWPDAIAAAAHPPVYPADRFTPLSLPMTGGLDDRGYFVPDPDQAALRHLLAATRMSSWADFDKAIDPRDNTFELSHPNRELADTLGLRRKVIPGLAAMHESTFRTVSNIGAHSRDLPGEAEVAARLVMDASKRFAGGDMEMIDLARLGKPHTRTHRTVEGEVFEVPMASGALSETTPYPVSSFARNAISRDHRDCHLGDGKELRRTFEALAGFQAFCAGLHMLNRYFVPSMFTRHENLPDAVGLHVATVRQAVEGLSRRGTYDPEYGDTGRNVLEAIAAKLKDTLDVVERELEAWREPDEPQTAPATAQFP